MCGIVGIFETRDRKQVSRQMLARMNESQAHRGPDDDGYHVEPGLGLGHRRLSIIDVATGQQPLYNEDHSVVVIFNGEIYNFHELIPKLIELGHTFRTKSDTEVIVHAWEAWGEDCVKRFRAQVAVVTWRVTTRPRSVRHRTVLRARIRAGTSYDILRRGKAASGAYPDRPARHGGGCAGGILGRQIYPRQSADGNRRMRRAREPPRGSGPPAPDLRS